MMPSFERQQSVGSGGWEPPVCRKALTCRLRSTGSLYVHSTSGTSAGSRRRSTCERAARSSVQRSFRVGDFGARVGDERRTNESARKRSSLLGERSVDPRRLGLDADLRFFRSFSSVVRPKATTFWPSCAR